jgi:dienelactone hydrolase
MPHGGSPHRNHDHHGLLVRRLIFTLLLVPALGLVGFMTWKVRAVSDELVNPPFYQPQSLARVQATYEALAKGEAFNPGGTWSSEEFEGLQLWTLKRAKPSKHIILLLHGFGDDRWGTSPALKWFPDFDAAIFTYRRRDDAMREKRLVPPVTFGAREHEEVVRVVHRLEARGWKRTQIVMMGRSLGASVGLLALATLERESRGAMGGFIWEGAPASSRDFAERLVRGPKDRFWHLLAPSIGDLASRRAGLLGQYDPAETDLMLRTQNLRFKTPSLCFLATQDRLAPPAIQEALAARFARIRLVKVQTWHLNCSVILGDGYAKAIQSFSDRLPSISQSIYPLKKVGIPPNKLSLRNSVLF